MYSSTIQARYADRFVDPALGFVAGINFFVYEAILIPFEVTAFNLVLHFWTDKIPVEATISFVLVLYVYAVSPMSKRRLLIHLPTAPSTSSP